MPLDLGQDSETLAAQIVAYVGDADGYHAFHAPRYVTLLQLVHKYLEPVEGRVLDIGATSFTRILQDQFGLPVDSLGFGADAEAGLGGGRHHHFDLNDAQWPDRWRRDLPAYDVVVMAEVIEHLHTSPALVLRFLHSLVRPGGVLIVQTPNAVRLGTRLNLLRGRHPFPLIREDATEPGHFREYTRQELTDYSSGCGFGVEECMYSSYFDVRYAGHDAVEYRPAVILRAVNLIYHHLPDPLKMGMTLVLRRPRAVA